MSWKLQYKINKTHINNFENTEVNNNYDSSLPASTATVAIYLNSLVQRSVSVSVLYSNYYSIKWYHDLNLHSNSCDDKLISVFLEGGKRRALKIKIVLMTRLLQLLWRIWYLHVA
jgi:hypothetical protein